MDDVFSEILSQKFSKEKAKKLYALISKGNFGIELVGECNDGIMSYVFRKKPKIDLVRELEERVDLLEKIFNIESS